MYRRMLTLLLLVATGALAAVGVTQAMGASGFRSGQQMDVTLPTGQTGVWTQSVTWGTPFSSGQTITVQVPANAVLPPRSSMEIAQCAAPDGVPPTSPASCDAAGTVHAPAPVGADGSFTDDAVVIHALTNVGGAGTRARGAVTCGATRATECVLYIGTDVADFQLPHFWSIGFAINSFPGDPGVNPGDGTPPRVPNRLDGLVSAALTSSAAHATLHSTCSIGAQPDSTCSINQVVSVTVTKVCPDGGSDGGAGCGGGGGGQGGGEGEGNGGHTGEVQGQSAELPFTGGAPGSATSSSGQPGALAFTGTDPGSLAVLGAIAILAGWLLQRRRAAAARRTATDRLTD